MSFTTPLPPARATGDAPPGGVAGDVNLLTDAIREVRAGATIPEAWRAALARRTTERVQVLVVGDSRAEGSGTTHTRYRWQTRLQATLRGLLGAAGGAEFPFIPAYPQTGAPMPVTRSGTMTQDTSWGIGWRTARITDDTGSLTFTFTGTSCQLMYSRGNTSTGILRIVVDGGAAVFVDTAGASSHASLWTSPALARGVHTVTVTRDVSTAADRYIAVQGLLTYDGDETAGLRFIDSAYSGASSNFLTASRVSTFGPPAWSAAGTYGLTIIALSTNDAAVFDTDPAVFRTNLQRLIDSLRTSAVGFTGPVVLLNMVKPSGITDAEYSIYEDVMGSMAADDPLVKYFNLRAHMPDVPNPYTDPAALGLFADSTHENNAGHQWVADVLADYLTP